MEATRAHHRTTAPFAVPVALAGTSGAAVWWDLPPLTGLWVFAFVLVAWLLSLSLHEYAHTVAALHDGSGSRESLPATHGAHPLLSVLLPVLFLVMGGIGLPGGAAPAERRGVAGRSRRGLVALAGPATHALLALALAVPFRLGAMDQAPLAFRFALAFVVMLQVTAALLGLLPVPGLDGYGVLEPWLPRGLRHRLEPAAPYGLLLVFACLWIPAVDGAFWDCVYPALEWLGVRQDDIYYGLEFFRFWQEEPVVRL
ncbi:site-2 protease family protein [Streptomyces sp. XM4193]|uniref:site-2 protease family protein n=1 Tax=Streptomyces sp. XM4193 TaxID=2929782 RepID=UPI001FF796D0|nr:site-2 protease family protein [Streptomyces sp. XM4193]MCK1796177.1 site-2 protease family protein [Streptomyces sp. XM4193]